MDDDDAISLADATAVLRDALFALATGELTAIESFTHDVIGEAPDLCVRSRKDLEFQLLDRAGALSNVEFVLDRVVGEARDVVVASWCVAADHTGEMLVNEDFLLAPTGRRVRLTARTRVEFREGRIARFRTAYVDDHLFDKIGNPAS